MKKLRQKCTKKIKTPTPATPLRPLCDPSATPQYNEDYSSIATVIGIYYNLRDTFFYFYFLSASKKNLSYRCRKVKRILWVK